MCLRNAKASSQTPLYWESSCKSHSSVRPSVYGVVRDGYIFCSSSTERSYPNAFGSDGFMSQAIFVRYLPVALAVVWWAQLTLFLKAGRMLR